MNKRISMKETGITLIALVVTIIILLILAGISINMVLGSNGIIERTKDAKAFSERQDIIEKAKMDILDKQTENYGSITEDELIEVLTSSNYNTQGTLSDEESVLDRTLTSKDGKHTIRVSEIYNGDLSEPQKNGKLISEIFEESGTTEGKMHIGDFINYPVYYDNVPSYVKSDWGYQVNGYSNIQSFVDDDAVKKYLAEDSYNGWKLSSVQENNGNTTIKLISAGVPINYLFQNMSGIGIYNLTVGFFDTNIITQLTDDGFYNIGFKSQNGQRATNLSEVKTLFDNSFTDKYKNGESATYTDTNKGRNEAFTNENVEGYPKVQSITLVDNAIVSPLVPCKGEFSSYYVPIWYPAYGGTSLGGEYLGFYTRQGYWRDNDGTMKCLYGVRVAVTLKSDVRFSLSEDSESTDSVKIWNLE